MRMIYSTIQKKIERICAHMEDSIFFSLLLLRRLSQDDACALSPMYEGGVEKKRCHLWEIVLTNREGDNVSSITRALKLVEPQFPFVRMLIEQNEKQTVKADVLQRLIHLLSDASEDGLSLAVIYETYLQRHASSHPKSAAAGDFYTPGRIAQSLAELIGPDRGSVYDPCCGSASLLLAAQTYAGQDLALYGQTQDEASYLRSQMNFILRGYAALLGEKAADTLLNDLHGDRKFDYILANPPFNHADWFSDSMVFRDPRWCFGFPPRSNANFAWLQHILSHLKPNGRAAVLLPNGTLTTQVHREADIREAIIALPPGLFYATRVPCCIWLLANTGRKSSGILFVDAMRMKPEIKKDITPEHLEQLKKLIVEHRKGELHTCTEWYGVASLEAIARNGFLLSPNLYAAVVRPGSLEIRGEYKKLEKLIDELSVTITDEAVLSSVLQWKDMEAAEQTWQKAGLLEQYDVFGGVTKSKEFFGRGTPLLNVKTVLQAPYVPEHFSSYVDVTETEKIKYSIKAGDVFLNRTSKTAKDLACCCVALKDHNAVYSGFIKRLRPRSTQVIDPLYAACYFQSEVYRWEIEAVSTVYTTYISMDNRKLSKIAVYYPNESMQKKLGNTFYSITQYSLQCSQAQAQLLKEFGRLLIRQYITYPVLCLQEAKGDYQ